MARFFTEGFEMTRILKTKEKGRYIFYLNEIKNKKYSYSSCSASRPLNMSVYPISLKTEKNKSELISETNNWIETLRENHKKI